MKRVITWLCVLVLVCTAALPVFADEITNRRNEAQSVNENIKETQGRLDGVKGEQVEVSKQLDEINKDLNKRQEELAKTEKKLEETTALLEQTRAELDEAIKKAKEYEELMADRLCAMYMMEGTSYLELLFEARSLNEFIDRFEMVKFMITYDNQVFDKMMVLQNTIEEKKDDLEEQEETIKETKKTMVKQKEQIEEKKKERQTALAKLEEEAAQYEKDLELLEETSKELESTIQRLVKEQEEKRRQEEERRKAEEQRRREEEEKQRQSQGNSGTQTGTNTQESSRGGGNSSGGGNSTGGGTNSGGSSESGGSGGGGNNYTGGALSWPVPGYSNVSSGYGNRWHPVSGKYKFHTGIDISGGGINGKNAVAAADGIVILSGYNGGYGNTVIIDHGNGITTLYAHGSSCLVSAGQSVSRGQAVLKIGSTGVSTGPHLHFEVRKNGKHTNPWNYLR